MDNGINLNEHIRIMYRHRKLILLSTVLVVVLVFVMSRFEKPRFTSTVKLAVFDRALTDVIQDNIDTKTHLTIANQLDILQSQNFKYRVAKALPPEVYNSLKSSNPSTVDKMKLFVKKLFGFKIVKLTPEAQVVQNIGKIISAKHRGGGVIQIQAVSQNPKKAQIIARVAADEFVKFNIENLKDRLGILRSFFSEQIQNAYKKLKDAEDELERYKQSKGLPSDQGQSFELSGRLNSIENAYIEVKTQHSLARDRLKLINKKLRELSEKFPAIQNIEKKVPQVGVLKDKLIALEKQRMLASAIYTNQHPKLVAINQQIDQTVKDLRKLIGGVSGKNVPSIQTVFSWQDLYIEKIFTQVEISTLKNKEASYKILAEDYKKKLLYDMPKRERHLYQLVQNVNTLRLNYQSLVNNNEKIQMVEAEKVGNVQVLMPASFPGAPNKQHQSVKIIFGAMLGLIFGIGLAYAIEWQNVSLRTIEEVEDRLNVPVLTAIPDFYSLKKGKPESGRKRESSKKSNLASSLDNVYVYHYPYSPASESLRRFQTQLDLIFSKDDGNGRVVLLTSAGPNEGKSTIAANLAVAMAQTNKHVVLIDSDLRRPSLHKFFNVHRSDGLVDILSDNVYIGGLVTRMPDLKKRLELVTSGRPVTNPMAVFSSAKLPVFLNALRQAYDYVIIDTPPLISFADSLLLGEYADGIVLVIEAGKTQESAAKQCLKMIDKAKTPFLGVVINKLNFKNEYGPYNYYNTYYKDYYREKEQPSQPLIKNLSAFLQTEQKKVKKVINKQKIDTPSKINSEVKDQS